MVCNVAVGERGPAMTAHDSLDLKQEIQIQMWVNEFGGLY
jgi:hypothetical protein